MVNTWKIVAAALSIFAAGVLTGGITVGITGRFMRQGQAEMRRARMTNSLPAPGVISTNQAYHGPGSPRVNQIRNTVLTIDLTAAQKDRIHFLTRESEEILRDTWEPIAPKIQRELRMLENRIAESLEPQQRLIFRDMLKKKPWEVRAAALAVLTNGAATTLQTNKASEGELPSGVGATNSPK